MQPPYKTKDPNQLLKRAVASPVNFGTLASNKAFVGKVWSQGLMGQQEVNGPQESGHLRLGLEFNFGWFRVSMGRSRCLRGHLSVITPPGLGLLQHQSLGIGQSDTRTEDDIMLGTRNPPWSES